jgi:hypothetical protein
MAVGLDADTDYLRRSSIPSGGAGTLSDGGFLNTGVGVWCYRPTSGNGYGTTAGGPIIHQKSGARECGLIYNSAGSTLTDPQLQAVYNSGGGAGTPLSLGSQPPLDTWCYFVFLDNATDGQVAAWRSLGSDTWNSYTRTNDNAGSQYTNTLTLGNNDGGSAVVMGWYAYARARYASGQTLADWLTYSKSDVTVAGDWGFWPLADNTDTGDDSGNARDLTFGGTITTETSPTLDGASGGNAARAMLHYGLRRRA